LKDRRINDEELQRIRRLCDEIISETQKVIIGKKDLIEYMLIALLAKGHILLEGVPGIAKTTMIKTFAQTLGCTFRRIQFTPDLLPSDITGTYIYNPKTSEFTLRRGPIFSNIVLADEINRAPPKTQAALLEAMQERQVTLEGETHAISPPFIVMATQNPIEQEGTYPLPEAQIDRFQMRLIVDYPTKLEEKMILRLFSSGVESKINSIINPEKIISIQSILPQVYVEDSVIDYIINIVSYTRNNSNILLGASPRVSISLLETSKARAIIKGRDYVIPDDVKKMVYPVLNHRIYLTPEAELDGMKPTKIIEDALNSIKI
jgi:MoxR-like ATPase